MSAPHYTIKTVADFLKVPEDRIDECLRDFDSYLHSARRTINLVRLMAEEMGGTIPDDEIAYPMFIWIDDGEHNALIEFTKEIK
jgi:hypothetical protein